jgi:hypothetical protein
MLIRPFDELTIDDKVMLLFGLFPRQYQPFLSFFKNHITKVLKDPESFLESWDTELNPLSSEKWRELLLDIRERLQTDYEVVCNNVAHFATTFTKGYMLTALNQVLQHYLMTCHNNQFNKAIEFLFEL